MLRGSFLLEQLLNKILGTIGFVILTLVAFLYPRIVSLISKATPEVLAQIIVLVGTLLILVLLALLIIISSLNSENKKLKSEPEFISRHNVNWKKIGNKIDSNPYCLCCNPPRPLKQRDILSENHNCEVMECVFGVNDSRYHQEKIHITKKNNEPISYKEAYKLVCEEYNIKPTSV